LLPQLLAETATRETFANLERWQIAVWYTLIVLSTAIFFWGVARLALKYSKGRTPFRFDQPTARLRGW